MTERQDTEAELFLHLAEAFAVSRDCEVPFHDETPEGHSGHAEWYVRTVCIHCGVRSTVFAACDKFVEVLKHGTIPMTCVPCNTYPATFVTILLQKIDEV